MCPVPERCSGGFDDTNNHPLHPDANPSPPRLGPNARTRCGKWMRWTNCRCKPGNTCRGYDGWMSTPELSWGRSFFPYGSFSEVPTTAIRDALRQAFRRWGMPECLRVDNGNPWGNWNDLPTAFALWVVGLGVRWHWNEPCCPQQNRRSNGPRGRASAGVNRRSVPVWPNCNSAWMRPTRSTGKRTRSLVGRPGWNCSRNCVTPGTNIPGVGKREPGLWCGCRTICRSMGRPVGCVRRVISRCITGAIMWANNITGNMSKCNTIPKRMSGWCPIARVARFAGTRRWKLPASKFIGSHSG